MDDILEDKNYSEQLAEMWGEHDWLFDTIAGNPNKSSEEGDDDSFDYFQQVLKSMQTDYNNQDMDTSQDATGIQYNTELFNKVGGTIGEYLKKIFKAEAGNNPYAVNKQPGQTAAGAYQFIDSTWKGMCRKYGLNYTLNDRFDLQKATHVMQLFTEENRRGLRGLLKREPTHGELYLAHFLGLGGALKVLRHRDDEPLTNVMSMKAINVNKGYCRQRVGKSWGRVLTIGEMKQILGRKMA